MWVREVLLKAAKPGFLNLILTDECQGIVSPKRGGAMI